MSYARFSDGDVYLFNTRGAGDEPQIVLECCGCILQEREWVDDPEYPIFGGYLKAVGQTIQHRFRSTQAMVDHLAVHAAEGHDVPDYAIPAMWADDASNFGSEATA